MVHAAGDAQAHHGTGRHGSCHVVFLDALGKTPEIAAKIRSKAIQSGEYGIDEIVG
ncbi:MAG: hypothetical protein LBU47_06070 [Christensenellaceae bacterium]|jgi:hypothetical protein|nr:hypothetical protein [Christensenellaceae bacterium]